MAPETPSNHRTMGWSRGVMREGVLLGHNHVADIYRSVPEDIPTELEF